MIETDLKRTDLLLKLLEEYAPKLRSKCEQWFRQSGLRRAYSWGLSTVGMLTAFLSLLILVLEQPSVVPFTAFAVLAGAGVLLFLAALPVPPFGVIRFRQTPILEEEIRILAAQVEHLVRTASQAEEHAEEDFAKRLQLDLRLAEAEGALRYSDVILGGGGDSQGEGSRKRSSQFELVDSLLEDTFKQFLILMHERNIVLRRDEWPFPGIPYQFGRDNGSYSKGSFSVSGLCSRLVGTDFLQQNIRDEVTLKERGHRFATWLVREGQKADFFESPLGSWGEVKTPKELQAVLGSRRPQGQSSQMDT